MTDVIHVLELSGSIAAAYAAKLLGDHGADVILVEPETGHPLRARGPFPVADSPDPDESHLESGGLHRAYNANKRSICLDFLAAGDTDDKARLRALLAWAEILVHSLTPNEARTIGLDAATLASSRPGLVTLHITPFGADGPCADWHATELIVANAGGWASLCPGTTTDPQLPPLKVFGDQCGLMTGICGAMTALAVHRDAIRTGIGEVIDLSEQAYVASVLEVAIPAWGYQRAVPQRFHSRRLIPWSIFKAIDGDIFLICVEQDQWQRLVLFMGNPDWATIDLFSTPEGRSENPDLIHSMVQAFVGEWRVMDLFHSAQKHRICFAPVMRFSQLHTDEHLAARGFLARDDTGTVMMQSAVLADEERAPIRRPAPGIGAHNHLLASLTSRPHRRASGTPHAPLAGIRVADFSWAWAGPFCSLNLAHLGADVIRIESNARLDIYRRYMIHPPEMPSSPNTSGVFNQWGQGKRSVTLDLTKREAIDLALDIVARSDVVVQNFGTGVLARLGLGYDKLKAVKSNIILASISGYGQTGPYGEYIGYGPSAAPLTGLCTATGYIGAETDEIGLSMPDPTAGLTAAWAVVSALAKRDQSGQGSHLDISLWEATAVLAAQGWMQYTDTGTEPRPDGNRDHAMSPHGCFPCAHGPESGVAAESGAEIRWLAIACRDDAEWCILAGILGIADSRFDTLPGRKAHEDELEAAIAERTKDDDAWGLTRTLQAAGVPAFPSLLSRDLVDDPQLASRGFIERLDHPVVGRRPHTGMPWRYKQRKNGVSAPAPCLGADTESVLTHLLGLTATEIKSLSRRGVLR